MTKRIQRPHEIRADLERKGDVVGLQLMDEYAQFLWEAFKGQRPDHDRRMKDWERRLRLWRSGHAPEAGHA